MALGLRTESASGDFAAIVKYDAKAGRMFRVDREQDGAGNWISSNVDITTPAPSFIIDLAGIEVGYISFVGQPDFKMVPLGFPLPQRPAGVDANGKAAYNQGFRVRIFSPKALGGVREWAATAKCVLSAMDGLHSAFEAAPESKKGLLPVVCLETTTPVTSGQGAKKSTNYAPVMKIVKWVERPSDFPAANNEPSTISGESKSAPAPAPVVEDNDTDF
jgi:hypothetical protein